MDEQPCDHQSSIARELGQIDRHGTVEFNARHSEGRHTALAEKTNHGGDRVLVGSTVFKTAERWLEPALVGSIPIRFRLNEQTLNGLARN
jgi:hypothetical protein